ncbi:MAG: hypothetical protein JOZ41_06805 [Chloroflexi bacterium]|nr:hypothetical protein [Chloroflexota bacterium]
MALEDYFESEVGIAVAATAIVFSPGLRNLVRRGIVYGLAGAMKAGDAVAGAARGAANQAQQTAVAGVAAAQDTADEARTVSKTGRTARTAQGE